MTESAAALASPAYRAWAAAQVAAGNTIEDVEVFWTLRAGPENHPFLCIVRPSVQIGAEGRTKTNEVLIGRPDIGVVVAYTTAPDPNDARVLLVREFRSPVRNMDGYVRELPGGSSWDPAADMSHVAVEELAEETGLVLDIARLRPVGTRQLLATLSVHVAHLWAVELSATEMDTLAADTSVHGVEADTERTWVEVRRLAELEDGLVDWSTYGMVAAALHGHLA